MNSYISDVHGKIIQFMIFWLGMTTVLKVFGGFRIWPRFSRIRSKEQSLENSYNYNKIYLSEILNALRSLDDARKGHPVCISTIFDGRMFEVVLTKFWRRSP